MSVFTKKDIQVIKDCLLSGNFKSKQEIANYLHKEWNKSTPSSIYVKVCKINNEMDVKPSDYGKPKQKKQLSRLITLSGEKIKKVGILEGNPLYKLGETYFFIEDEN